jgi:hypothetical protein
MTREGFLLEGCFVMLEAFMTGDLVVLRTNRAQEQQRTNHVIADVFPVLAAGNRGVMPSMSFM